MSDSKMLLKSALGRSLFCWSFEAGQSKLEGVSGPILIIA